MSAAPDAATWTAEELALRQRVEAGETVVANLRSHRDLIAWATRAGLFVLVDRRSPLGNPFVMRRESERAEVCDKYVEHLRARLDLIEQARALRGRVLGCWCAPRRCHGDTLAGIANGELRADDVAPITTASR